MQKICEKCGKTFITYPSRIKKHKGIYCSKECFVSTYTNRVNCVCKNCGKEYSVATSQRGNTYCSRECMDEYLYKSGIWNKKKNLKCEYCGGEFIRFVGNMREGKQFCSHDCYAKSLEIDEERYRENRRNYTRDYRRNNVGKTKAWKHKRRALENGYGGSFTDEEWERLLSKYNNRCAVCGKQTKLSADHIIPISKWGDWAELNKPEYDCSDIENIQPLCGSCNSAKHNKILNN